ncbi:hypothetical protein [Burkholderia sp. Bp9143]|uniref:hypothetical protein n=1 Tax=Burkholderia sp. Bp9143 TaxID=2184574 RepID=UPI0021AB5472|nr:hypothetical protein [Burkholderia sp. Bp9143]
MQFIHSGDWVACAAVRKLDDGAHAPLLALSTGHRSHRIRKRNRGYRGCARRRSIDRTGSTLTTTLAAASVT